MLGFVADDKFFVFCFFCGRDCVKHYVERLTFAERTWGHTRRVPFENHSSGLEVCLQESHQWWMEVHYCLVKMERSSLRSVCWVTWQSCVREVLFSLEIFGVFLLSRTTITSLYGTVISPRSPVSLILSLQKLNYATSPTQALYAAARNHMLNASSRLCRHPFRTIVWMRARFPENTFPMNVVVYEAKNA